MGNRSSKSKNDGGKSETARAEMIRATGLMGNRSSKSKNDGEKSETARAEMIRDPFGFYWKRVYAEKRQTVLTSYDPGS